MSSLAARLPGRKLLMTLVVVGLAATSVSFGVFSAFSSTTTNPGNNFSAGTLTIGDNDGGTAVYNASNQKPGQYAERCIKVTYTGSLPSTVTPYRSAFSGGSGSATWSQNDTVAYKIRATLQDDDGAQDLVAGSHSFTWEARNN